MTDKKITRGRPKGSVKKDDKPSKEIQKIIDRWDELINYLSLLAKKEEVIFMLSTSKNTLDRAIAYQTEKIYGEKYNFSKLQDNCHKLKKYSFAAKWISQAESGTSHQGKQIVWEKFFEDKEESGNEEGNNNIIIMPSVNMTAEEFNKQAVEQQKQLQENINKEMLKDEKIQDTKK